MTHASNALPSAPHVLVHDEAQRLFVEGQRDAGRALLEAHLREHGEDAHGWALMGSFAYLLGDARRARSHTRRAISIQEDVAVFHQRMALYLRTLGRPAEARISAQRSVSLLPTTREHRQARAAALAIDASCARDLQDVEAAVESLREAVALDPEEIGYVSNLAVALGDTPDGQEEAISLLRACCRRAPTSADLHHNLGRILDQAGRAEAFEVFAQAVKLDPGHEGACVELARAHEARGEPLLALDVLDGILERRPNAHQARFNRGLTALRLGRWDAGLRDFEARYLLPDIPTPHLTTPRWSPAARADAAVDPTPTVSNVRGAHLLVMAEQGLGDTLQFARLISGLRGPDGPARVTLAVHPRLRLLLADQPGVDEVVSYRDPLPAHDAWVGTMTLPYVSGRAEQARWTLSETFAPAPERLARWERELPSRRRIRAAICWQGNPGYAADAERSIPVAHFVSLLAEVPGLDLISLQAGHGSAQLEPFHNLEGVHSLSRELDADGAFVDSAAVLRCCDLLISSDTAIVHLAGAMGVRTWLALGHRPDWRWGLQGHSTPWYPSLQLFRQPQPQAWNLVFEAIATALKEQFP